jgi:three-Cys-motif partner protein
MMSRVSSGQGQSGATIEKSRGISKAFNITTLIVNNTKRSPRCSRFDCTYWHCDLNAGSGWNDDAQTHGSPILFCHHADTNLTHTSYRAIFCEKNKKRRSELKARLRERYDDGSGPYDRYGPQPKRGLYAVVGKNERALEALAARILQSGTDPQHALGSVLIDPNGYFHMNAKGKGVPVESVIEFFKIHTKIDLIMNLNITAFYRVRGARKRGRPTADLMPDYDLPIDILNRLKKEHWWIKHTDGTSKNGFSKTDQFLLSIGRNIVSSMPKNDGFVRLGTQEGNECMRKICRVAESDANQELDVSTRVVEDILHVS